MINNITKSIIVFFISIITTSLYAKNIDGCSIAKFSDRQIQFCLKQNQGPLLVLESGLGNDIQTWPQSFLKQLKIIGSVLMYNRIGYGKSHYYCHKINRPITAKEVSKNLYLLLQYLKPHKPIILIGHSIGGLYIQYFAKKYSQIPAGLVLIDSSSPNEPRGHNNPFASHTNFREGTILYYESAGFNASLKQFDQISKLPEKIPLAVVSATNHDSPAKIEHFWQELQYKLLSQSLHSKEFIAEKSGHEVYIDQPETVLKAIRWVISNIE